MTIAWIPPAGSIPTLPIPSLRDVRCVHLVGIGGAGMRNLARLLLARGVEVHGSDLKDSRGIASICGRAARRCGSVTTPRTCSTASPVPDVLVTSSAIRDDNAEVRAATQAQIPVWRRQQALAALTAGHRTIAVAGTHGKTTTTSLLARTLEHAGLDPSYLIGGDLNETGGGARHGARRPVRVRSRRERRLVPAGGSVDRDRHEHRGRPCRLLSGWPARDRGRVRRLRGRVRRRGGLRR